MWLWALTSLKFEGQAGDPERAQAAALSPTHLEAELPLPEFGSELGC